RGDPAGPPIVKALLVVAAALALAAPALASESRPTLNELEGEVMCPICHTTLDQSGSPAAQRIKAYIGRRIRAGHSKSDVRRRLIPDCGPATPAGPPKHGFGLLAWLLPTGGILAGGLALGFAAWRGSQAREPAPAALAGGLVLDPELD